MFKTLCLAVSLFCTLNLLANNFIVTSNAESGPGSFRDMLMQASQNGTATTDTISFNLPDVSLQGRTISVMQGFTEFSSNLVIDASSQPGLPFGNTQTKVMITIKSYPGVTFTLFTVQNVQNLAIYGLYLKALDVSARIGGYSYTGILLNNVQHFQLGDVGKGNILNGWAWGITNQLDSHPYPVSDVTLKNNFIGVTEAGSCCYPITNAISIWLLEVYNVQIGGYLEEEGNLLNADGTVVDLTEAPAAPEGNYYFKLLNNKIQTSIDGTKTQGMTSSPQSLSFVGAASLRDTALTKSEIIGNVIAGQDSYNGIILRSLNHTVIVKGNRFGTEPTGQTGIGYTRGDWLTANYCYRVLVGGPLEAEKNYFAGAGYAAVGVRDSYKTLITNNSIFCNTIGIALLSWSRPDPPFIRVSTYTQTLFAGTANANARIEIFKNQQCNWQDQCQGKMLIATTTADASGNWQYSASDMNDLVATATTPDSATSEFTTVLDDLRSVKVQGTTCGKSNGSVTGVQVISGTDIQWADDKGNIVSTDTNLVNVPKGVYTLKLSLGANQCSAVSYSYEVKDVSPPDQLQSVSLSDASCGKASGAIAVYDDLRSFSLKWTNALGDSLGDQPVLRALPPGSYALTLAPLQDSSCPKTYGPYTIRNLSGASLDITQVQITAALCGDATGSIQGLAVAGATGSLYIQWLDSLNRPVSQALQADHLPAGRYQVRVKDQGSCDTLVSPFFTVPSVGSVSLDTTGLVIVPASCSSAPGGILHLGASGAENFSWVDTRSQQTVGSSLDLTSAPAGSYQLHLSNHYGCSEVSPVWTVPVARFSAIYPQGVKVQDGLCAMSTGLIEIARFDQPAQGYTFEWRDSASGSVVGTSPSVYQLGAGTYELYARDSNDCSGEIYSATIQVLPVPVVADAGAVVTPDRCDLKTASITGLAVTGLAGPTNYTWMDSSGAAVGSGINATQIGEGTYVLKVVDGGSCTVYSRPFVVENANAPLDALEYSDVIIPRNSAARLIIQNPGPGLYSLYADAGGTYLVSRSASGNFVLSAVASDTSVYIQRVQGSCSSSMARVNVKVVDASSFALPSAFTPNGDGLNDRLHIRVLGYLSLRSFQVYNRYGEMVFATRNINDSWDGTYKGVLQPGGVYVWMAEGVDLYGKTVRSKGTVTLIK